MGSLTADLFSNQPQRDGIEIRRAYSFADRPEGIAADVVLRPLNVEMLSAPICRGSRAQPPRIPDSDVQAGLRIRSGMTG